MAACGFSQGLSCLSLSMTPRIPFLNSHVPVGCTEERLGCCQLPESKGAGRGRTSDPHRRTSPLSPVRAFNGEAASPSSACSSSGQTERVEERRRSEHLTIRSLPLRWRVTVQKSQLLDVSGVQAQVRKTEVFANRLNTPQHRFSF